MITDIENKLLIRYLRKELNDAESQQVVSWLQANEANRHFLFGLKEAYMLSRWVELSDKAGTENGWSELKQSLDNKQPSAFKKWIQLSLKYAAVATIFLTFGFLINTLLQKHPQINMIETASGNQSSLVLADGSKVTLNENSKLTYSTDFNQEERNVTLQGEAYFEVIHNSKKPFYVHTSTYIVKDLGTKFDVEAYPDRIYSYTSLKKGKVQILANSKGNEILSELQPGTQLAYNKKTGAYSLKEIDINSIANWSLRQIAIRHKTLSKIAEILSSKYGYTIEVKNSDSENLKYNIIIDDETLDEILSNIHFVTPQIHYSINHENKMVIIK